ncbi:hypothetical protein FSP39_016187 [Pinctada imbricata]|uniref:dipeptidyl-peptidase IV n=1 Tax=Pinctada imbricata TaxID=66713 RepID=A0AA88Y0R4_PINIB|nr:hypothetical protein FSP39_016187 [Pinctada imbricata]
MSLEQCEITSSTDVSAITKPPTTLSWGGLHQGVVEKRKFLTALASHVPNNFTFRTIHTPDGALTRLYFLGIPQKSRENTLLYVDIPKYDPAREATPILNWRTLFEAFQPTTSSAQLSKEEQLLRERKRLGIFGITSYDIVENEGKFIFPACNNMYVCLDNDIQNQEAVLPMPINTSCSGARMDAKICPHRSSLLAFIHCNDIWVTNLWSDQECRLTFAHKGLSLLASDPLSAGVPSFVVQEEFDRYTGYWWEPVQSDGQRKCRILYEEVDESEVEILHIFGSSNSGETVDECRYPRAGSTNAKSTLKIVEFEYGEDGQIQDDIIERQLREPLQTFFPWMEYIVRAGWTPDARFVYAQLMNRQQTRLSLVLIPVECFIPISESNDTEMDIDPYSKSYLPLTVIYEDKSDVWINTHDILHFLPHDNDSQVKFVWASEKTGFRHLYSVTSKLQNCDTAFSAMDLIEQYEGDYASTVIEELPLTSGEWEVNGKQIWVDSDRGVVYFMGHKDTVLESHLYSVSYISPGEPVRITLPGFSHQVSFSNDFTMFVSVYSRTDQTPTSVVYDLNHSLDGVISTNSRGTLLPSIPKSTLDYHAPELFSFRSKCGFDVHTMLFKPHNYEPGIKYPTVLMVYGGPQVQQVTNSFKGIRFLRHHTLASQGYAVVVVDGRGSCTRGIQFEAHIKNRLGTVEIEDQVEGLQWLSDYTEMIDMDRVAIHGWSYGGYLSLLGLAQRPDVFKIAMAGAPVVNWKLYDTGYTERYMDVPEKNPEGYENGSVLSCVEKFPDEENRLLIIHGLIDENVHFHHTSSLINALVKACKPYRLQIYPNERHGIRSPESSEHYKTMILSFLQHNL